MEKARIMDDTEVRIIGIETLNKTLVLLPLSDSLLCFTVSRLIM
jgi:hypothetical protein